MTTNHYLQVPSQDVNESNIILRKTTNGQVLKEGLKFPRSVFVILFVQLVTKFSQAALQGALPLYFVDKLKLNENEATVTYHVLETILFIFAVVGGLLADSYFGMYKVLLCSLFLMTLGLVTLTVGVVPTFHLPIYELTLVALILANIGYGIKAPCIYSFGGDQFSLPHQAKQLSLFFVQVYAMSSIIGSVLAHFVTPILRKDVRCFGELSCYSLVFATPAAIILIGFVVFITSIRLFKIRKPEVNVIMKIIPCICHAFSRKWNSTEKKDRLLDYAGDKYESDFIEDIRSALQAFVLVLPASILSALDAAEATTMTFQASRMNGEVAGYLIKPDQIQIVRSISVIVALPTFQYFVYPFLEKFCSVNTPLKKMALGLFIAALSYYAAAIVEMNLEKTYAPKPMKGIAHLRIYNTLDCRVMLTINGQKIIIDKLAMWENLDIAVTGKKDLQYSINLMDCWPSHYILKKSAGSFNLLEMQANSLALTEEGLSYQFIDQNTKSESGNPLLRALVHASEDARSNMVLKIKRKKEILSEIPINKNMMTQSDYFEVVHGIYDIFLVNQQLVSGVSLKIGGVYTVLGHITNSSITAKVVTVTPPNSVHILWVVPQQFLFSVSIVMFDPTCFYFLYSQAPPSMTAFIQSHPDITMGIGHIIVAVISFVNLFDRKVFVFLMYAVLMTIATMVFVLLAKSYKYRPKAKDDTRHENIEL